MKKSTIAIILFSLFLGACGDTGRSQNRKLKEAYSIHEEILSRHDSIYAALEREKNRISSALDSEDMRTDKRSAYKSMLRSIDKSFRILGSWEESVVGVPGFEHDHGDHAHHDHDHASEDILDGMSDSEILELQKAYRTRLNDVAEEIEGLLTTIEMYENAN